MEIHFGIAIAATRTYFFVLVAALVAVGLGQVQVAPAAAALPAEAQSSGSHAAGGQTAGKRRSSSSSQTTSDKPRQQRSRPAPSVRSAGPSQPPLWRVLLPYALLTAIILLVLDWDFISNQAGRASMFTVFIQSWVTHLQQGALVSGPGALWIVLFTLVAALILALGETWTRSADAGGVVTAVLVFLAVALGVWLLYGLVQANRLLPLPDQWPVEVKAAHVAGHASHFYLWLGLVMVLLAASLVTLAPGRGAVWSHRPLLAGATAVVLLGVALFAANRININLVRADIYFKLAQTTDSRRDYDVSLLFYDSISGMAPSEDYYQLFRGRALLEAARASTDAGQQQALLSKAEQVLIGARSLNPLNTDHSANLARYFGTVAATQTDEEARTASLRQASDYYAQAVKLSPNAAHLQNEWGTVYTQLAAYDDARARFDASLALDPTYADTYLRRAQMELQLQDWEAAAADYERATQVSPRDVRGFSGVAYAMAQLGRLDDAIAANLQALAIRPNDLSTLQNLALLHQRQGRLPEALDYARQAREVAPQAQQATFDALIQQIQQQMQGG